MRLDRDDIFPVSVIVAFGIAIPIAFWVGFGSRQQIAHDVFDIGKYFAVVCIAVVSFIAWFNIRLRKREKRFLRERGEQSAAEFAALFESEPEREAARRLFSRLQSTTATRRLPRMSKEDQLNSAPLFLVPDDLNEEIEELCEELDICTTLDPDAKFALYNASTVSQLVSALARFIERQGLKSPAVTA
jgi:hypothetical protein